jgi:hypothetical protein
MKSVGFVGKIDKTELVEYVAKFISALGKKVIIIDATLNQKTRHTIPVIINTETQGQYVVQHDGIEVAVGFSNILELKKHLLSKGEDFTEFEYILIDTDIEEMCEEYDFKSANNLFFITSFDKMYINKSTDLLKYICATKRKEDPEGQVDAAKVLMYSVVNTTDSRYIDQLTENLPVNWNHQIVNVPYDDGDLSVNIQNQYSNRIDFRYLTPQYKKSIMQIVSLITGENINMLKKVLKNIDRTNRFSA